LAVPSTGEQFEGAFQKGVPRTLTAPFRWVRRTAKPDHWLELPFPFNPAVLRSRAQAQEDKGYAPLWNCQTMALGEGFTQGAVIPAAFSFVVVGVVAFLGSVQTAVKVADYFGADLAQWREEGQFAGHDSENSEPVNPGEGFDQPPKPTPEPIPEDPLLELTDALVAAEEGLKAKGWKEEEARKLINRIGENIMFEDSTAAELDLSEWSPPEGDSLGQWVADFAHWVGKWIVKGTSHFKLFSDLLKLALDAQDRAVKFFQPIFDVLFTTGLLVATTSVVLYESLRHLIFRATHFLFSEPLAIRGLKAAWGPAGIINNPYASLRYQLRSSMAMAEFKRQMPAKDEYKMQVRELTEARDLKDTNYEKLVERAWRHIPTHEAFGGHQSRPYRLQMRPVMTQQEKDQYEREAAELNIDFKAKIEPYFTARNKTINAPQAVDGAMLAAINPSVVLPSALRYLRDGVYNDGVPLLETDTLKAEDRRDADEAADAVFNAIPEAMVDPKLRSEDHYLTWMMRRGMMKYNTDSLINADSRMHAYHDGLLEAAKKVSQKRMREGVIRPMFFSVFPKSQPVAADPLFTADSQGVRKPVRTVYGENLVTIMQNARVGLEMKNRTPAPHWDMVSKTPAGQAYSRVFQSLTTHQYSIEGDASQLDAHFQAFHMRMLDRLIERGVSDPVIAKWLTIRNEVMRNSFAVMLTLPKGTSIPEYLEYGRAGRSAKFGNVFFKFRGGGTGEASTSWTDTWLMKPIMARIMMDYANEAGLDWKMSDFFDDKKSKFTNSGDDNVWGLTLPLDQNGERPHIDAALFQRCAHRRGFKLELGIFDDYRAVTFLGCKGRPPTREDKLAMADLVKRFANIDANPDLIKYARINPEVLDPNTDSPPEIIVYRDLETTWIRRTAATRGRAMVARDDEYLMADIQKLEGHKLLTANLPHAYNAISEDLKVSLIRYLWAAADHPEQRRVNGFIEMPQGEALRQMEELIGWNPSQDQVVKNMAGVKLLKHAEAAKRIPWVANQPLAFKARLNRLAQLGLASYPKVLAIHYGCMPKSAEKYQAKYDKWFAHLVDFDDGGKEFLDDIRGWSKYFDRKFSSGLREVAPQMEWINQSPDVNQNVACSIWLKLEADAGLAAGTDEPSPITLAEFVSISKRGSFCIYDPVKFWYRAQDPAFLQQIRKHPLWVYKNANWVTVQAFIAMWFFENWLYSVPVIGLMYGLYMFMVVDMNKVYSFISCLYWLATLDTSTTISSWFPRDPYIISKITAGTLTQMIPVHFYYLLPFAHLSGLIADLIHAMAVAFTRVQMLKPFAGTGASTNPWTYESDEIFDKMESDPETRVAVQAPTGSGKSSDAIKAYLEHMRDTPQYSEGRILLLVPARILLATPFSGHLNMGSDDQPVSKRRYQVLRRGVTPAGHVSVYLMTYHHALTRIGTSVFRKDKDVVVMDEIHQSSPYQRLVVQKLQGFKVIMTTATPSPWKGLIATEHVSRQQPRWKVEIKTFDPSLGVADMWNTAFKDETTVMKNGMTPHQAAQRSMILCATRREVEATWHALNALRNSATGLTPVANAVGLDIISVPPVVMVGSWIKPGSQQWTERETAIRSGRYVVIGTKSLVTGFDAKPPPWFLVCGRNIHQDRGELTRPLPLSPQEFKQAIGRLTRFSNDRDGLVYTHSDNNQVPTGVLEYPETFLCSEDFGDAYDLQRLSVIPAIDALEPCFPKWPFFARNPEVSLELHVWTAIEFITLLVCTGLSGTQLRSWYTHVQEGKRLSEDYSMVDNIRGENHFPGRQTPSFDYAMACMRHNPIIWNVKVRCGVPYPLSTGEVLYAAEPILPVRGNYIRVSEVGTKQLSVTEYKTAPTDEATWAEDRIGRLEMEIGKLQIQLRNQDAADATDNRNLVAAVQAVIKGKTKEGPWNVIARDLVKKWEGALSSPSRAFTLTNNSPIPDPTIYAWGHCNEHLQLFTIEGTALTGPSCGCRVFIGATNLLDSSVRLCSVPLGSSLSFRRVARSATAVVRETSGTSWTSESNRGSYATSGVASPIRPPPSCECPIDVPGLCAIDADGRPGARERFHKFFGCRRFSRGWFETKELQTFYDSQGLAFVQRGKGGMTEWRGRHKQAMSFLNEGEDILGVHWSNGEIVDKQGLAGLPLFIDLGEDELPGDANATQPKSVTRLGIKTATPTPKSAHAIFDCALTAVEEGLDRSATEDLIVADALQLVQDFLLSGSGDTFREFKIWCTIHRQEQQIYAFEAETCGPSPKKPNPFSMKSGLHPTPFGGGFPSPGGFKLRKTGGPTPRPAYSAQIENPFMNELRSALGRPISPEPELIQTQEELDAEKEAKRLAEERDRLDMEARKKIKDAMSKTKEKGAGPNKDCHIQ
jgi:hypothetical protein